MLYHCCVLGCTSISRCYSLSYWPPVLLLYSSRHKKLKRTPNHSWHNACNNSWIVGRSAMMVNVICGCHYWMMEDYIIATCHVFSNFIIFGNVIINTRIVVWNNIVIIGQIGTLFATAATATIINISWIFQQYVIGILLKHHSDTLASLRPRFLPITRRLFTSWWPTPFLCVIFFQRIEQTIIINKTPSDEAVLGKHQYCRAPNNQPVLEKKLMIKYFINNLILYY